MSITHKEKTQLTINNSIADYLYMHANKQPEKTFLFFSDEQYSFKKMAQLVSAYATHLEKTGVRAGDRIALICGNRPAFLIAWLAINELGAIVVPLNTSLKGDSLRYTLTHSESKKLLIEPDLLVEKKESIAQLKNLDIELIGSRLAQLNGDTNLIRHPSQTANPLRPASILFTSGTTGLPKGVVISHQSYLSAGRDMCVSLGLNENERIMVFLPLFHANPQMYAICSSIVKGCSVILLPRFSASGFFTDAVSYQATGFTYVGTVLAILEKQYPSKNLDHHVQWCVGGGAPKEVWEKIESRFGTAVRELYGMTETGGWVSMNTVGQTKLGSVGKARHNVTLKIKAANGAIAGTNVKGEILAYSSEPGMFFSEYWNNPIETASTIQDGWVHTGDRGWLDEEGFLYFDGREKELIRRGGEMISPTEIELCVMEFDDITDCAVVGVADEIMGEEIKLVVVIKKSFDLDGFYQYLIEKLPKYMVPKFLTKTDFIPKTETQKIKRHELNKIDGETINLKEKYSSSI